LGLLDRFFGRPHDGLEMAKKLPRAEGF